MAKYYEIAELVVTWLDRTPWGRKLIALGGTLIVGMLSWIERLPASTIFTQALTVLVAMLMLFAYGLPVWRRSIQLPLDIEVKGLKGDAGGFEFPLFLLNRSTKKMSLQIQVVLKPYPVPTPSGIVQGANIVSQQLMAINGIKLNLEPNEDTQGTIGIPFKLPSPIVDGKFELRLDAVFVDDRISRRKRSCQIPGQTSYTMSEHGASF